MPWNNGQALINGDEVVAGEMVLSGHVTLGDYHKVPERVAKPE